MSRAISAESTAKPKTPDLPYIDGILGHLAGGDEEADVLWERHLHWGYWKDPSLADGTNADFAEAAELLAQLVFDAAKVTDGDRVLDCGCGVGGAIASMNERFSGVSLTGLNIDERQLAVARQRVEPQSHNSVEFVHGDACDLPFEDESFDAVTALECIPHFPSRRRFLREVHRVLRPGGRLAVTDVVPLGPALPLTGPTWIFSMGFYGSNNLVPTPMSAYHALARATGMRICVNDDITKETLPTFDVLGAYFGRLSKDGEPHTRRLAKMFSRGWLKYRLMAFEKR